MTSPRFLQLLLAMVGADLALFRRFPRLRLATFAIALVPPLYALIYLSSVWDPNTKTSDLPVAIVNLDQGYRYQGRDINVGTELSASLRRKGTFGFREEGDAEQAGAAVRRGELAFALVIPADFSRNAVPGETPGQGKLRVLISEGNNYSVAGMARRFAAELGHQMNETLNEKRWSLVLDTAAGAGRSLEQLRGAVTQLRVGARQLDTGAQAYSDAAGQVAGGFKQTGAGVRQMVAKLPAEADLKALKTGTQQSSAGQRELGKGLEQMQAGARQLNEGAGQLREQSASIPFVGGKVSGGAGQLAAGSAQLVDGLGKARDANTRLVAGAAQIEAASAKLADGMGALGDGLQLMNSKLPEDDKLNGFADSGKALAQGAGKLRGGVELLYASLPAAVSSPEGSAPGLANSVQPVIEVDAPVANNGSAFAPNMVAVALWLGAVLTVNVFQLPLVLSAHAGAPRLVKSLGKYAVPAMVVSVQAVLVFLMMVFGLGIVVSSPATYLLTLLVASMVFLGMVYTLVLFLGDAGKLVAVLLLTLQLAAGGGVMPVELSGGFFRLLHDWLPFTWVVAAFRASLFGAYDNQWMHAWGFVVAAGGVAFLLSTVVARWQVVDEDAYLPGIKL